MRNYTTEDKLEAALKYFRKHPANMDRKAMINYYFDRCVEMYHAKGYGDFIYWVKRFQITKDLMKKEKSREVW